MTTHQTSLTPAVLDYIRKYSLRESRAVAALRAYTATLPAGRMQIEPEQGQAMAMLVKLMGARRILEIGTFTGYSALVMAEAMPEDGHLITCDIDKVTAQVGLEYWQQAGLAHKIELRLGPALDTLDQLLVDGFENTFDMVFIDADKANYINYFQRALWLVRMGGVVMIDNVLWGGKVAAPIDTKDKQTLTIHALNEMISQDNSVGVCILPVGDGLTIVRKEN